MKTVLLTLFAFVLFGGYGQGLNTELGFNDNYDQYTRGIVAIGEHSYFVKRQHWSTSFFTSCSLIKTDTLGTIIWEVPITPQFAETMDVHKIIPSESGGIYVMGHGWPTCDVAFGCFWFIQKYEANGFLSWTKIWEDEDCFNVSMSGLSMGENNELLINYFTASDSKIYYINFSGTTTDSVSITPNDLDAVETLSTSYLIASAQSTLYHFDASGNLVTSLNFSSDISGIETWNNELFVLTEDSIFLFDTNLQLVTGTDFPGYSAYSGLKVTSLDVRFMSSLATDLYVLTLDHNLQMTDLSSVPLDDSYFLYKDYSYSHLSSPVNFSLTEYSAIRFLDFSLNSAQNTPVNSTDIGIIAIEPTQISAIAHPWAQDVYDISISADVLLKNFGSNTLTDCRINHHVGPGIACNQVYYTAHFSNLNLAPGDSIWLSLGLMHQEQNYFPGDTLSRQLCVYSSHPNFTTDLNVPNDVYCGTVIIGYAGTVELEKSYKTLVKIVDYLGRETEDSANTPLIYIYSDGTTEKVFRVE